MHTKTYIVILILLVVFIITYYANYFKEKKEFLDAQVNIIKPNNTNIDNLDVKQLKNLVNEQNNIINKQTEVINKYIEKNENNDKKFNQNVIKPNEDIETYFKSVREENDKIIKKSQQTDKVGDIFDQYKNKINVVKRYLEDPIMRGSNIYESEQYSKLFDIGNIKIDNPQKIEPMYWSKNFK
jgi:hypothetical protein